MEFYLIMVKHSQITSLVFDRLSARKTRKKSARQILLVAQDLDKQLRQWHNSLPSHYRNGPPFKDAKAPSGISQFHISFISLVYNSCLIVIHTTFCYPWIRLGLENDQGPEILAQRQKSLDVVATAAREIIIVVSSVSISVGSGVRFVIVS